MNNLFYTRQQWKVFVEDLSRAFVRSGFEIVEEPYIDYALFGFRATYIRRYLLHKPTPFNDGILTTIIHVAGLPFGWQSQKMVILAAPRDANNQPVSDTLKLRIHFDNDGSLPCVVDGEQQQQSYGQGSTAEQNLSKENCQDSPIEGTSNDNCTENRSNQQKSSEQKSYDCKTNQEEFFRKLEEYISHILEAISPGLIELPIEMKLEILKKLSVDSIIRMSQVNHEFRSIIFEHGESLWRHLCLRDFNIHHINRNVYRSWHELYRDSYILRQVEICRKERALPGLPVRPALPPVPFRLQIEWWPEVLELPFYPHHGAAAEPDNIQFPLALELLPLRRADSLDSI